MSRRSFSVSDRDVECLRSGDTIQRKCQGNCVTSGDVGTVMLNWLSHAGGACRSACPGIQCAGVDAGNCSGRVCIRPIGEGGHGILGSLDCKGRWRKQPWL